jgi:uncharacterized membrane protein YozB (DUF420 family)
MQTLLGPRAAADFNLIAQLMILVGLWLGAYFARRQRIRSHQRIETSLVLVESFLILSVMVNSFYTYVIANHVTAGVIADLMMVHGTLGLIAELAGIYLILRMSTSLLPARLQVRNFRLLMRALLGLWTVIALLGFAIYYYRYMAH